MTHFGFLSTYPPTRCGLATFTEALAGAMTVAGSLAPTVVRVLDSREIRPAPPVIGRISPEAALIAGDRMSMRAALRALNRCDVAIIQHEYGIYGGADGEEILPLLRALATPAIVVLHTVLVSPTAHQRSVLETVCRLADAVVVMTENASAILRRTYNVKHDKVRVIPHGVPVAVEPPSTRRSSTNRVLTWGLISQGKGLEWGIRAIAELRDRGVEVEYVIAGQTHPKVVAHEGERYRRSLESLIRELGLHNAVTLDNRYLDAPSLAELIASADVVMLPYESRDQAASGVLVEAVAAGVPVVATGFPHAVELLGRGAGLIADYDSPHSLASAVHQILGADGTAEQMRQVALRETQDTTWPAVAAQYRLVAARHAFVAA